MSQEEKCYLIAQEVKSAEYKRRMSSTYAAKMHTRGMVVHVVKRLVVCTKGAMIHKVAVRRCGHEGGTTGVHQQALMHI